MKRMIWIAIAGLLMIGILGYGMHTMKHIQEVNRQHREKEKGEKFASQILMTTETTSIWDKVRVSQETTQPDATDAYGNPIPQQEETTLPAETQNAHSFAAQTVPGDPDAEPVETIPPAEGNAQMTENQNSGGFVKAGTHSSGQTTVETAIQPEDPQE